MISEQDVNDISLKVIQKLFKFISLLEPKEINETEHGQKKICQFILKMGSDKNYHIDQINFVDYDEEDENYILAYIEADNNNLIGIIMNKKAMPKYMQERLIRIF